MNEDKFAPAGDYVPTSRTVNGKALSSNISLSASDVGAAPIDHIHKSVSNPQMNYVDALATAEDQSICPLNTTTFLRWYHPTNGPLTNIDGYAIIRKLNVAPYIDLEFIQSGTGRRWLNTKGDNGWTGWVEKGTLEDVGAAPAGYTIYSGYFSSDSMLETRIANAYAGVADGKIGFAEMDSTSNAQTLMSGKWFFTIYRQNASTGFLIAEAPTASGTIKFQRTLSGGAWGSWVNISASAFAPAGFGLGTEAQGLNASHDLNTISQSGWYLWSAAAPANAPVIKWDAGYGYMRVDGRTANDFTQTVYSGYSDAKGIVVTRSVIGGTPGEWEWVNPPLTADETEYRTTERVNDKAVYKMMDAKGRLFWRLDGETAWKTGAPGCKAASVAVEYSLNTAGWYKIGTLYSGESHCSIATVSIGAWFNYSPSNAIVVDIAGSYLSVDATVRSRTGYAPDN